MSLYTWKTSYKNDVVRKEDITQSQIDDFKSKVKQYCPSNWSTVHEITNSVEVISYDYTEEPDTYGTYHGVECACVGTHYYPAECPSDR